MSTLLNFLESVLNRLSLLVFNLLYNFVPVTPLLAIVFFAIGYICLVWRRDYSTAIEMMIVAWLLGLMKATWAVGEFYRMIVAEPSHRIGSPGEILLTCFANVASIFVISTCLSIPVMWTYWRPKLDYSLFVKRWSLFVVLIVFLDLFLLLVFFLPALAQMLFEYFD
ncbi:MAG: hypothetical protein KDA84_14960 [Planctomycetaceae bacterium]|nr:hypothetical protein [Planctomycetaceae bacterium]